MQSHIRESNLSATHGAVAAGVVEGCIHQDSHRHNDSHIHIHIYPGSGSGACDFRFIRDEAGGMRISNVASMTHENDPKSEETYIVKNLRDFSAPVQQIIIIWQLVKELEIESFIIEKFGEDENKFLNAFELNAPRSKVMLKAVSRLSMAEFESGFDRICRHLAPADYPRCIVEHLGELNKKYGSLIAASLNDRYVAEALRPRVEAQKVEIKKLTLLLKQLPIEPVLVRKELQSPRNEEELKESSQNKNARKHIYVLCSLGFGAVVSTKLLRYFDVNKYAAIAVSALAISLVVRTYYASDSNRANDDSKFAEAHCSDAVMPFFDRHMPAENVEQTNTLT